MTKGDPLNEHFPILHIDTKPQLELMVFRDELSQAGNERLAQAIEESSTSIDVCACA